MESPRMPSGQPRPIYRFIQASSFHHANLFLTKYPIVADDLNKLPQTGDG